MSGYDFLDGLLVLEVAQLGPDGLGGILADMGATVVKVETPGIGDPIRYNGPKAVGNPDGFGYQHMRWNRGKKSLTVNLKDARGRDLFLGLAEKADIIIEGMRAGVMDRLGLGFADLRKVNPRIVFCSVSGMGATGPYAAMASHGPSFDAYGGLGQIGSRRDISNFGAEGATSIGMHAVSAVSAYGVLAAVIRAIRSGIGASIEIAAADCAALWLPDSLDPLLNEAKSLDRPGFSDSTGRMLRYPRMDNYRTSDDKAIYFMGLTEIYWQRFAKLVHRPDLATIYHDAATDETADTVVRAALTTIFSARSQSDWIAALNGAGIPVMPVNSFDDVIRDPHFVSRNNVYEVEHPEAGTLTLTATPIKTDQSFRPALAPELGQNSDEILAGILGMDNVEIAALRQDEVIG